MNFIINNGISVIICCYNSAQRLPETLKHLALQVTTPEIKWEVIIIDNASTDNTAMVAQLQCEKYNLSNFKILYQPKPGKNHAYKQGIYEAAYEYILTCDDDNWLSPNYIATAFHIINSDNHIGVLGGCGIFEPQKSAWNDIEKYKSYYVNGPQAKNVSERWVYGAGSVCRKSVLKYLFDINWQQITPGRQGNSLICGEDVEICFMFYLLGYKIIADDRLLFKHFVPLKRQNEAYILKMSYWSGYTNVLLNSYYPIINNVKISINQNINTWYVKAAKVVLKQYLLQAMRKIKNRASLSIDEKISFQSSLGTFVSLYKNKKKVIKHHRHILSLLNNLSMKNVI